MFLTEINANIENLDIKISPQGKFDNNKNDEKWNDLKTELFFDNGQIVMEIDGLVFSGTGNIFDVKSGLSEKIEFSAILDLAQLVLTPD